MKRRTAITASLLAVCLLCTQCLQIEQEFFFNLDGSGEYLLHISIPGMEGEKKEREDPAAKLKAELEKFRTEIEKMLPPAMKVKDLKSFARNGLVHTYALLTFKDVKDLQAFLGKAFMGQEKKAQQKQKGKDSKGKEKAAAPPKKEEEMLREFLDYTKLTLKKNEKGNFVFSDVFSLDLSKADEQGQEGQPPAKPEPAEEPSQTPSMIDDLGKSMEQAMDMIFAGFRLRFVVHTPTPIVSSTADYVIQEKTAIWDFPLNLFMKKGGAKMEIKAEFSPQ